MRNDAAGVGVFDPFLDFRQLPMLLLNVCGNRIGR
jgi:hypothetical protein